MDIAKMLKEALEAVDEAGVPTDLRAVAFEKALDLMAGRQVGSSGLSGLQRAESDEKQRHDTHNGADDKIATIARQLGIGVELVADAYHPDESKGSLELILPAGSFPTTKKAATQEIALLVAGGNQLGGLEEWTPTRTIKEVVEHYGRLDSPNFAKTVLGMGNVFGFKGKGQQREVRLNRIGHEELAGLIKRLVHGGEA